jgi:hypothetical protein
MAYWGRFASASVAVIITSMTKAICYTSASCANCCRVLRTRRMRIDMTRRIVALASLVTNAVCTVIVTG